MRAFGTYAAALVAFSAPILLARLAAALYKRRGKA